MKKRGMVNEVFVYIFVIIVIAFIFLFGFNMIKKLSKTNEQTTYLTFRSDFLKSVDNVYYKNEGSVFVYSGTSRNKPLILPNDVKEICFNNNRINFTPPNYNSFEVDNLVSNLTDDCMNLINHKMSYKLENIVLDQETFVEISEI